MLRINNVKVFEDLNITYEYDSRQKAAMAVGVLA